MRDREAIEHDLLMQESARHTGDWKERDRLTRRLAGDVGPLLERLDDLTVANDHNEWACGGNQAIIRDLQAKVAEQEREIERLQAEYAEHMSHASGQIYDLTVERDALSARLAEVDKERDDAGLRWGEHYNRRLAELEDARGAALARIEVARELCHPEVVRASSYSSFAKRILAALDGEATR